MAHHQGERPHRVLKLHIQASGHFFSLFAKNRVGGQFFLRMKTNAITASAMNIETQSSRELDSSGGAVFIGAALGAAGAGVVEATVVGGAAGAAAGGAGVAAGAAGAAAGALAGAGSILASATFTSTCLSNVGGSRVMIVALS